MDDYSDDNDDTGGDGHADDNRAGRGKRLGRLSEIQNPGLGIRCPDCHGTYFRVVRTVRKADKIVRRRECRRCGRLVLSTERLTG